MRVPFFLFLTCGCLWGSDLFIEQNRETGGLTRIGMKEDGNSMDFIQRTDGSQYPWITGKYGWGLGQFRIAGDPQNVLYEWDKPVRGSDGEIVYMSGPVEITVSRLLKDDDLTESYSFVNKGDKAIEIRELGIRTPFNDNYPDAETCVSSRVNAHVWGGGSSSWVNAMRMSGKAPHLGLVLLEGALDGYEVQARGADKGVSNTRGVLMLNAPAMKLSPGERKSIKWKLFSHKGMADFWEKALKEGAVRVTSPRYVYELGDEMSISFERGTPWEKVEVFFNGKEVPFVKRDKEIEVRVKAEHAGEVSVKAVYDSGKTADSRFLVVSGEKNLLDKRAEFIVKNQQFHSPDDSRDGAFMVYDNQEDRIFLNDWPSVSSYDRDEGRERLGMGVLIAMQSRRTGDKKMAEALNAYYSFVRRRLQDEDYKTYSNVRKELHRGYNYPWVAHFYLEMYRTTGEKKYLEDYCGTMKAFYKNYGYQFYAIGIPVEAGITQLRKAGMEKQAEALLADFVKMGDAYVKNSYRYPKHEVNYEQSIVAPAVTFLCELYLVTKEQKYLDEARRQMPLLEAFAGDQPSYHLHDIAIRHWDGYWFGKREMWGDVFPHYWSALSAMAFHYYARCMDALSYQERAKNIVRNNLCLFTEAGKGSCAYVYPHRVNGQAAQFYDEYANDQDWALVFYLMVNDKVNP